MRHYIALTVCLLFMAQASLLAQAESVEFQAYVFDGSLPQNSVDAIADRLDQLPSDRRADQRVELTLDALRTTRTQLASTVVLFSAIPNKVTVQRYESDTLLFEARVVQWESMMKFSIGAAYVNGATNLTCQCTHLNQTFPLGQRILATSSTESVHIVLVQSVSDDEQIPIELPKDFGNRFRAERIPNSRQGVADITMR